MSSGSESDDEYVPEENPEKLSEEESADDETEKQYENEVELKNKKRKLIDNSKGKKMRKVRTTRNNVKEIEESDEAEEIEKVEELDPDEQKKKDDDLWAMFLDGTDTKPKSKDTPATVTSQQTTLNASPKPDVTKPETKDKQAVDAKEQERRIFEFAGETIVVENDVIKERIKTGDSAATVSNIPSRTSTGGGISGLLGALNKKNKLSVLEKTQLDWKTLKKEEGFEDEIKSHNKGKNGYLDRRDFLERADMRQYEIERELRMSRRSNR